MAALAGPAAAAPRAPVPRPRPDAARQSQAAAGASPALAPLAAGSFAALAGLRVGLKARRALRPSSRARGGEAGDALLPRSNTPDAQRGWMTYKEFLLITEEERPLYYRVSDTIMTAYGAICFLTSVLEPETAARYHFNELEDFINVSFFVKFLLLFWSNDWKTSWLFTGIALLDLASCLPVISIPVRFMGAPGMEEYLNLLQIARFLRLLVEAAREQRGDSQDDPVPLEQQLVAVLLSLLGTMAVCATVLFLYENPEMFMYQYSDADALSLRPRSFEDCLLYMVNLFAGRDLPWMPQQPLGKLVSAAATCLSIVFIPFLVSRTVELFMSQSNMSDLTTTAVTGSMVKTSGKVVKVSSGENSTDLPSAAPLRTAEQLPAPAGTAFWATAVARLDKLAELRLLSAEEASAVRRRCLLRDPPVEILQLCYNRPEDDAVFARRLREMLDFGPFSEREPPRA